MRRVKSTVAVAMLIAGVALGSVVQAESGLEDPTLDWMPKGIDWEQATTVVVELEDNVFVPDEVVFQVNKPYKVVLDNISDQATHDLADLHFFHAVVIDRITAGGTTINTPHIHNLVLRPNSKATVYLVPIKPSEYDVYCSVPGHRDDGMEGYFTIKEG